MTEAQKPGWQKSKLTDRGEWVLAIAIAVILAASLPFKFSGHPQPTHIFDVVGAWVGLDILRYHGAILIGVAELVSSILVLIPSLRIFGAGLTIGILAGAILFHLVSPLGTTVYYYTNAEGQFVPVQTALQAGGPYGVFDGEKAFIPDSLMANAGAIRYYQGVDSELFYLALLAFSFALVILFLRRGEILALLGRENV